MGVLYGKPQKVGSNCKGLYTEKFWFSSSLECSGKDVEVAVERSKNCSRKAIKIAGL